MRPLDEQQFPAVVRLNRDGRAERVLAVVHPTAGRAGRPLAPAAAAQLGRMPAPGAGARLAGLIVGSPRVLTTSASSVVRDALIRATERGSEPSVSCLESRPGLEGVMLANELAGARVQTRLAVDAAAARLAGEANLVLV